MAKKYVVDDPYDNGDHIVYESLSEALQRQQELDEARADWNHGNGPNWPVIIYPAERQD